MDSDCGNRALLTSEQIESIIYFKQEFHCGVWSVQVKEANDKKHTLGGQIAKTARQDADNDRAPGMHVSTRGSGGNEASDGAGAQSYE